MSVNVRDCLAAERALNEQLWPGFGMLGLPFLANNAKNPQLDLESFAVRMTSFASTLGSRAAKTHEAALREIVENALQAPAGQDVRRLVALAHFVNALQTSGVELGVLPLAMLSRSIARCASPTGARGADHWTLAFAALALRTPFLERTVATTLATPHPDPSGRAYSYAPDFQKGLTVLADPASSEAARVEVYDRLLWDYTVELADPEPERFILAGPMLWVSRLRWHDRTPTSAVADRFAADLREHVGLKV